MSEKQIAQKFVQLCRAEGWLTFKFEARTNDPDRIVLIPGGRFVLVELKRPGEVPRKGQLARMMQLDNLGFFTLWDDNAQGAISAIKSHLVTWRIR